MAKHREPQTFGEKLRRKAVEVAAYGATAISLLNVTAACGNADAKGPEASTPVATAPATPGASESQSPTAEQSPANPETIEYPDSFMEQLESSKTYKLLTGSDREKVDAAIEMKLGKFEALPFDQRALTSVVLTEAAHRYVFADQKSTIPELTYDEFMNGREGYFEDGYETFLNLPYKNPKNLDKDELFESIDTQIWTRSSAMSIVAQESADRKDGDPQKDLLANVALKINAGLFGETVTLGGKNAYYIAPYKYWKGRMQAVIDGDPSQRILSTGDSDDMIQPKSADEQPYDELKPGFRENGNAFINGKDIHTWQTVFESQKVEPQGDNIFAANCTPGGVELTNGKHVYPFLISNDTGRLQLG